MSPLSNFPSTDTPPPFCHKSAVVFAVFGVELPLSPLQRILKPIAIVLNKVFLTVLKSIGIIFSLISLSVQWSALTRDWREGGKGNLGYLFQWLPPGGWVNCSTEGLSAPVRRSISHNPVVHCHQLPPSCPCRPRAGNGVSLLLAQGRWTIPIPVVFHHFVSY